MSKYCNNSCECLINNTQEHFEYDFVLKKKNLFEYFGSVTIVLMTDAERRDFQREGRRG